jgi:hypothetical protein
LYVLQLIKCQSSSCQMAASGSLLITKEKMCNFQRLKQNVLSFFFSVSISYAFLGKKKRKKKKPLSRAKTQ